MKKIILVLLTAILFGGINVFGQGKYGADSAECIKYLSYYQDYYKTKNYNDAMPNWRKAYKLCPPTASQNLFVHGAALMRQQISKNSGNPELKAALVDTLMTIYDTRIEYYPKSAVSTYNNKGLDLFNFKKDDNQAVYDGCKEIIAVNKTKTNPNIYLYEMLSAVELYKQGTIDAETLISLYDELSAYIKDSEQTEALAKVKEDLDNAFIGSKVASCENLIALFTPRYESNPNDIDLLNKITSMLNASNCIDNDLFYNAVNSKFKIDPSYTSAYYLYKLSSNKNNTDEAIKFLEQAIAFDESDTATDAGYYYELAVYSFKNGKAAKAFDSALKAVELDNTYAAKAYMLCGQIWGSQVCGNDYVSKRAPYWVAVDYLNKAKAETSDSELIEEANKLIRTYSAYYPQASEAFMYDVSAGQSYTVSCGGMRATTTVRTQK